MPSRIVVHYGEIGTKGGNRQVFEGNLRRNILGALGPLALGIRLVDNRFLLYVDDEKIAEAKVRLGRVLGIVWFAQVEGAALTYPEILEAAVRALSDPRRGATFRVSARRPNKSFGMTSQELARNLGEDIIKRLGLKVKLDDPDTTVFVDVISREALVYRERLRGPGGLPVGVSGRVLHLLSGGIDSPVAAWLMMKRGCKPTFLHFYVAPEADQVVRSKIGDLVRILSQAGEESRLILIPFTPYQLATTGLPTEFEPVVFRRFMRMVAEQLATRLHFPAISTGDNLAQVASQTLQNISCIDRGAALPTLRPLLGYDKDEIIQLARKLGTYETSIVEYKDCCSIISRHPRTRMKVEDVDEAVSRFRLEELVKSCISMGSVATCLDGVFRVRPLVEVLEHEDQRKGEPGLEQASSR